MDIDINYFLRTIFFIIISSFNERRLCRFLDPMVAKILIIIFELSLVLTDDCKL